MHLQPGTYTLGLSVGLWPETVFDAIDTACDIEVVPNPLDGSVRPRDDGAVRCELELGFGKVGGALRNARRGEANDEPQASTHPTRTLVVVKLGLMVLMTGLGVAGGLVYAPFLPAAIYHFFAVLRPQYIWGTDLDPIVGPDFPWSLALALSAIVSAVVWRVSFWIAPHRYPGITLPRLNVGHYLFGFFALWITASYMNGEQPAAAERFFDDYRKIFLMFYITCLVMVTARQVGLLYILITIGFVFIAFEDNQLYFFHGRYNFRDRTFAGLDNNGAALLLAMGVPLCIYAWDGIRHWIRWAFPIGILLIVHAVLISMSRGAMLALMVTSPLYLLRCRNKKMIIVGYLARGHRGADPGERPDHGTLLDDQGIGERRQRPEPFHDLEHRLEHGQRTAAVRLRRSHFQPVHA